MWKRVDARSDDDFVVAPDERLDWFRTIGLGAQHVCGEHWGHGATRVYSTAAY